MSGNQQPQISLPTWLYSDFNAAIPIKKRKYFVQPEEAGDSALLENNPQANEQSGTRSALYSSDAHVNQKIIGEGSMINIGKPIPSLSPSVSVGITADKPESIGNVVFDQIRVKVEEPINSSPLTASEIPSSSDIVGSSLHCSLGKLPMGAEQHHGVVVTSDETGLKVEQTVLKTHVIVGETCGKEILRGECQTEASAAGAGNVALQLDSKTNNNSPYWENDEPTVLNLSLSKGVCAPHDPDFISTCTKSGIHSGVNRSNWDLNTTMDAWEDGLDRKTRVNEGRIVQDGEQSAHQIIHASEGVSGVSTLSGENVDNPETVDNDSPDSYKAEISTFDNDPPAECSEGSQSRIKTLDASDSFVPLRMERDRSPDFSLEQRKYLSRGSDESCNFSRERYHGKIMRSPRLNFMPEKRRFSDNTESNLHDRDTKNFESNNYGNPRWGGAFTSNSHRGRRPANDEVTHFPHSFTRRTASFSFTQRGSTNKEDASTFHGFRDGEKITRGLQSNNTEPMFMSQPRPYQGRNSFARGRTNFSNNPKRGFAGFRSRSPIRSRDRSAGPSSSFRNRSQEDFSGHTDFSHRRSPSGYRMGRISSPDHSGYQREMVVRRHNSPPYSHRPLNAGRGRGNTRGRGYGRDGISFRKPYDRVVLHRNHGNLNNLDPRERVDYSDEFFDGPIRSERFGVDVKAERRQFGYRHDITSSFRPSFGNDGCAPTNVENGPDPTRFGQKPGIEIVEEQGSLMETDGKGKNSTENASGRTKNMEEEETSKHSEIWQQDELGIEIVEEQGSLMETDGRSKNLTENASGRTKYMEEEETSKHSEIWQQDELGGVEERLVFSLREPSKTRKN